MHFFKELLYTDPYVRYVLVLQTKYNFELLFINMKMHFCQVENLVKFQAKHKFYNCFKMTVNRELILFALQFTCPYA